MVRIAGLPRSSAARSVTMRIRLRSSTEDSKGSDQLVSLPSQRYKRTRSIIESNLISRRTSGWEWATNAYFLFFVCRQSQSRQVRHGVISRKQACVNGILTVDRI